MRGANPAGLSHFFVKNQLLLFLLSSKIANSGGFFPQSFPHDPLNIWGYIKIVYVHGPAPIVAEVPQPSVFWIISEICDNFCLGDNFLKRETIPKAACLGKVHPTELSSNKQH